MPCAAPAAEAERVSGAGERCVVGKRQSLALMDDRGVHELRNTLEQAMDFKESAGIAQPGCSNAVLMLVSCQLPLSSVCSSPSEHKSVKSFQCHTISSSSVHAA
jgi:hypothetical protein